jgi:hypothetical protein
MLFRDLTAVYCEIHMKNKNAVCRQKEKFQYVKAGGAYTNH